MQDQYLQHKCIHSSLKLKNNFVHYLHLKKYLSLLFLALFQAVFSSSSIVPFSNASQQLTITSEKSYKWVHVLSFFPWPKLKWTLIVELILLSSAMPQNGSIHVAINDDTPKQGLKIQSYQLDFRNSWTSKLEGSWILNEVEVFKNYEDAWRLHKLW